MSEFDDRAMHDSGDTGGSGGGQGLESRRFEQGDISLERSFTEEYREDSQHVPAGGRLCRGSLAAWVVGLLVALVMVPLSIPVLLICIVSLASAHEGSLPYFREIVPLVYPALAALALIRAWFLHLEGKYRQSLILSFVPLLWPLVLVLLDLNPFVILTVLLDSLATTPASAGR